MFCLCYTLARIRRLGLVLPATTAIIKIVITICSTFLSTTATNRTRSITPTPATLTVIVGTVVVRRIPERIANCQNQMIRRRVRVWKWKWTMKWFLVKIPLSCRKRMRKTMKMKRKKRRSALFEWVRWSPEYDLLLLVPSAFVWTFFQLCSIVILIMPTCIG